MTRRVAVAGSTVLVAVVGVLAWSAPSAGAGAVTLDEPVPRLLIISIPTVSWDDLRANDLPNLEALLAESAVADLSTRAVDRRTTPGDAYATISAGTRADGVREVDGLGFEVGERFQGSPANEVFARRTGTVVQDGLFSLAQPRLERENEALDFGAEIGALGDAIADAGYTSAVVANADGAEPPTGIAYGRSAVNGLMTSDGVVSSGRVGPDLLQEDPLAPFGKRLDNDAVAAAAAEASVDRSVVLVEASDLVRADDYRDEATDEQRRSQRQQALQDTDALVGRLLEDVDPERDAVLVVGPHHRAATGHLTIAGLRAPGVEPGLLKSAVTRRSGFVSLVDVAPTVIDLIGGERPSSMEGRAFQRSTTGGDATERVDFLADADLRAQWRDTLVAAVATAFVIGQLALWVGSAVALRRERRAIGRGVRFAALAVLGVLPATYLAGPLPFHEWGAIGYWAFIVAVGAAIACLALALGRRDPADPLIVVLGVVLGVILIDVMLGGRLQFNTVFGYTPTVAGRFAGIGNLAFAQVAASATILAGLLASRVPGRRGAWIGVSVMAVTLVVVGSPFWGSDVGGVLTLAPALAVVAVLLFGLRLRWRTLVLGAVGAVTAMVLAGLVDLARPEGSRTHLGRLFEDIEANGYDALETVVVRKLGANLSILASSEWTLMLPIVFGSILYLIWRAPGRLEQLQRVLPQERAARAGFVVAAVLGFALNDSGVAVPGLMLGVMNASLVYLVLRVDEPPWRQQAAGAADLTTAGSRA
jgi:hypothetical protein